jgi:uncharacterized membrane protein YesL
MARIVTTAITTFKSEFLCNNSAVAKAVITVVLVRPNTHIQRQTSKVIIGQLTYAMTIRMTIKCDFEVGGAL